MEKLLGIDTRIRMIAKCSTSDGRLKKDQVYEGWITDKNIRGHRGWRFFTYDNRREWMTFNLNVFAPAE